MGAFGIAFEGFDFLLGGADLVDDFLFVAPLCHHAGGLLAEVRLLFLDLVEACGGGLVGLFFEGFFLHFELHDLAFEDVDLGGHGVEFDFHAGGGLVYQIDGLVREEAVGDVAV